VKLENWDPFFPFGAQGAFAGAGIVFFSYIGFDSVTTLAGEVARPSRDLPLGIVGTLSIATCLYVGVSLVVTGMVNYTEISVDSPLTDAFENIGLKWAAIIVAVGGVTALVASTLCSLLGQPRIYYQMAMDGLIPKRFGNVNPKTQVPVFGTLVTGVTSSILALCLELSTLTSMISIGTLLAFTVVCAGVIVMRCQPRGEGFQHYTMDWQKYFSIPAMLFVYFLDAVLVSLGIKHSFEWWVLIILGIPILVLVVLFSLLPQPNKPTTFQCPLVPFFPLLGILVNTFLIVQLNIDSIYRVMVWTMLGMLIYFGYGIRHSKLNYEVVSSRRDSGSYLNAPPGTYSYMKIPGQ
jgi:basic amino acid/polyamine antiporter, APA family